MIRTIFNIILLSAAGALLTVYILPEWNEGETSVMALKQQIAFTNKQVTDIEKLQKVEDGLREKRNAIPAENLDKLKHFMPPQINPVLFIMELNSIARDSGMSTIEGLSFDPGKTIFNNTDTPTVYSPERPYETFEVSFAVRGTYVNFLQFLKSIERNLRITDISTIQINVPSDKTATGALNDVYSYSVTLQTYSLKK